MLLSPITVAWRGSPIIFHFVDFLTPTDTLGCMLIPLGVSSILKDFKESKLSWKVWDSNPCSILSKVFIVKTRFSSNIFMDVPGRAGSLDSVFG